MHDGKALNNIVRSVACRLVEPLYQRSLGPALEDSPRPCPLMPTTLTLNAESSSNWHHRPHISISTSPQSERPLKRLSVSRYTVRRDRGHFSSGGSCHEEEESLVPSDGIDFSIVVRQRVH